MPRLRRKLKAILLGGISLVLLSAAWFAFAPRQLPAGSASYVLTSGTSMLPLLEAGDLAIVRESATYRIGDVVAYNSDNLETVVLHRIIRVEGDRFVLQGDNNSFMDSDRPTHGDLIGRLWLHSSAAGSALEWLRSPRNAAILTGAVAFLLVGGFAGAKVRRSRRRRRKDAEGEIPKKRATPQPARHQVRHALAAMLAAALVGFTALGLLAFSRPPMTTEIDDQPYVHRGTFAYSAVAPRSDVYPKGVLATGEPVFLRLVPRMSVRLDYRMETDAPHAVSGTSALTAVLRNDTGWSRVLELQPPTPFTGDVATASGSLDLGALRQLMVRVGELTRVPQSSFSLKLLPRIEVEGTVATEPIAETFAPELPLLVDEFLLQVDSPDGPDGGTEEMFERSQEGSVPLEHAAPSRLEALGLSLEVGDARRIALIGVGVTLLLALLLGLRILLRRPRDEITRISARYRHLLVPVSGQGIPGGQAVEVATMEALVQVAERYERSILHVSRDGKDSFVVEGDVLLYRYTPELRAAETVELPIPSPN